MNTQLADENQGRSETTAGDLPRGRELREARSLINVTLSSIVTLIMFFPAHIFVKPFLFFATTDNVPIISPPFQVFLCHIICDDSSIGIRLHVISALINISIIYTYFCRIGNYLPHDPKLAIITSSKNSNLKPISDPP